jgi:hypothetical protein
VSHGRTVLLEKSIIRDIKLMLMYHLLYLWVVAFRPLDNNNSDHPKPICYETDTDHLNKLRVNSKTKMNSQAGSLKT